MEEHKEGTLEKIKTHFRTNKKFYIGVGLGVAAGALTMYLLRRNETHLSVTGILSSGNNNIMNVNMYPLGHPGNVVRCLETGRIYASQGQAAREMGLNLRTLSNHLNGHHENVNGYHFSVLGLAGQELTVITK